MHNLSEESYDRQAQFVQPWLSHDGDMLEQQATVKAVLTRRAGATIGNNCFIAADAYVFTDKLYLGDNSWISTGAIIRGQVQIGADCSINPYAHIAGLVSLGRGCRIASMASIYGFNHGFSRLDIFVKDQPLTSEGVKLGDNVWVGASAIILDGVEIGSHCIIAAGAVVTKSFGEFQVIAGNPAKAIADRRDQGPPISKDVANERGPILQHVRALIHNVDPYDHLEEILPPDLQGWGSYDPLFEKLLTDYRPKLIVEVGTWKGASAIHMANLSKKLGLDAELVCVDTWLGNWQHWSRSDGVGSRVDLRPKNGFPMLYFQFMSNVVAKGHQETITPLPLTGIAAAKLFQHHAIRPDFVYIDGDHEYETVIFDLREWLNLLSEKGILMGDDFSFPGVKKAANEIADEGNWSVKVFDNKFLMERSRR